MSVVRKPLYVISAGAAEGLLLEQLSISPSVERACCCSTWTSTSTHATDERRRIILQHSVLHGDVCQAVVFLSSSERNFLFGKF